MTRYEHTCVVQVELHSLPAIPAHPPINPATPPTRLMYHSSFHICIYHSSFHIHSLTAPAGTVEVLRSLELSRAKLDTAITTHYHSSLASFLVPVQSSYPAHLPFSAGTVDFLRSLELSRDELDKAIIGCIGDIDSYQLPDAKGRTAFMRHILGVSDEERQQRRCVVLWWGWLLGGAWRGMPAVWGRATKVEG